MYTIFPYTTFRNYMVIIYNKPCIRILFSIPIYIYIFPYIPLVGGGEHFSHSVGKFIIPTDELHHFQRDEYTTNQYIIILLYVSSFHPLSPTRNWWGFIRHWNLYHICIYIYTICIPYVYHIISIYTRYCGNSVIGRCLGFGQIQRGAARLSGSAHQGNAATPHLEGVPGSPGGACFQRGKWWYPLVN